ncbi:MAG: SGNH/GDSL hydrolase family protein [Planctomycetota bacterium]|nr:SGNH/GDSL hydrolase family protein [Planctomycetota bacterium]MDA1137314.1 SGNH/GDSL hydrolase family protein [Planctomycetota bacterium]
MSNLIKQSSLILTVAMTMTSFAEPSKTSGSDIRSPSFDDFERRAKAGEHLTVVFFGASLTWGANASDPNNTSYRGRMADHFREHYPNARFQFYDSAIGGTGSQLGVFRFERDVIRRKPDLVFLDFSANDDIYSADPESLASYEAIVRRLVHGQRVPTVVVMFPFRWNTQQGNTDNMKGRDAHLQIAKAYGVPAGDAITLSQQRVKAGQITLDEIWPLDGVHPGDAGYALFADAAWHAYLDGVQERSVCRVPERMLHADTYMTSIRLELTKLGKLPVGWEKTIPNRTSAWFDALMSRWQDSQARAANFKQVTDGNGKKQTIAQKVEPITVKFIGTSVLIFGERTPTTGKLRAWIDDQPVIFTQGNEKHEAVDLSSASIGGNTHLTLVVKTGLAPNSGHILKLEPVLADGVHQELRIESICIAGPGAKVSD